MTHLQKALKQIMSTRNLTQVELAKMAHVSQNSISKWLNGDSSPKIAKLEPLAKALNISVGELIGDFGGNAQLTEDDKRWLALSPKHKKLLLTFLDAILESQKE